MNRPESKNNSTRTQTNLGGLFGFFIVVLLLVFVSSCGGSSSGDYSPLDKSSNLQKIETAWHDFLNSDHYSGYIAVMFKADTSARLRDGQLVKVEREESEQEKVVSLPQNTYQPVTRSGLYSGRATRAGTEKIITDTRLELANEAISYNTGEIKRGMDLPEETIEKALAKAKREGKRLHDWNLYYTIKATDPDKAEAIYHELSKSEAVEWVHPVPFLHMQSSGYAPDISGNQTYIDPHSETGGLNIEAAWDDGITGQGVRLLDMEGNWNFDHEDLPLNANSLYNESLGLPDFVYEPPAIEHGTAIVGILSAMDNGYGVTGISHGSDIKLYRSASGGAVGYVADVLETYAGDSENLYARPGDILVLPMGSAGPNNPDTSCIGGIENVGGCLPAEAYYSIFSAIEDATTLDLIIVAGAGNGGLDLDSEAAELPPSDCGGDNCPDLATDDSGAIMVAGSMGGTDVSKYPTSNCGSRVNAYAWGYGVTTTGYGNDLNEFGELIPNPASDPTDQNEWYTNSFNGTSASTALVAGAVALVQSYAKDHYKDIIPHKAVYLDAWQMRELINLGGTAGNSTCNIGKKPDVGAMMSLIENGFVLPTVAPDTEVLLPKPYAVAGIRYDIDKDGRADLISYNAGIWKIDLSSVAPAIANPHPDNYGEWDLQIEIPLQMTGIIFPVVHDYDSDGDADLAIYDSKNGRWYIKYTTLEMLPTSIGGEDPGTGITTLDWDRIVNYSADSAWEDYSRAVPGDYNGDNYLDLAMATPDGRWLIDYGGIGHVEKQGLDIVYVDEFGAFEEDIQFLTAQQLVEAPGWAYSTTTLDIASFDMDDIIYRVPDGTSESGYMYTRTAPDFNIYGSGEVNYGDNDKLMAGIQFGSPWILIHDQEANTWSMTQGLWDGDIYPLPQPTWSNGGFCRIVPADYNGDGIDDVAVKCNGQWKITYYDILDVSPYVTLNSERIIELSDSSISLPPTIHSGGMKYQEIKGILEYYNLWDDYQDKDPFAPHTVQCIKYWAPSPPYCLAK